MLQLIYQKYLEKKKYIIWLLSVFVVVVLFFFLVVFLPHVLLKLLWKIKIRIKQLLFLSILDFITLNRIKNKTWGIFLFSIKKHHSHTGVQITHLSLWVFANLITQQIEAWFTCTLAVGRFLGCSVYGQVSEAS